MSSQAVLVMGTARSEDEVVHAEGERVRTVFRAHGEQRDEVGGEVEPPVVGFVDAVGDDERRQDEEGGGEDGVQGEDGGGGLVDGFALVFVAAGNGVGGVGQAQSGDEGGGGHQRDDEEQSGDADPARQQRAEDEREDEGDADAGAEDGHGFAEFVRRGDVGGVGERDGGNRPHALHGAGGNHHFDVTRAGGEQAARGKEGKAAGDDGFAPVAVGKPAAGYLQQSLA